MVSVNINDYKKVWKTLAKLSRKGVEITSENVIDLIRCAGFKKNNSTIRRLIYDGIQLGIIRSEFIYTGSMTLNKKYIPEKYELDVSKYRSKLLKKIDSYVNITYPNVAGELGIVFKCNDCGNPMIPPTETKCPVCGSQNLSPTDKDEVKEKYFSIIKSLSDDEIVEIATVEVEGGIPAVVKRLKSMIIKRKGQ